MTQGHQKTRDEVYSFCLFSSFSIENTAFVVICAKIITRSHAVYKAILKASNIKTIKEIFYIGNFNILLYTFYAGGHGELKNIYIF